MRDVPYIFGFMLLFVAAIVTGGIWYATDVNEDSAVSDLNAILRTSAVDNVSLVSRVDPGMVYLKQNGNANFKESDPDFETDVLKKLAELGEVKEKSVVRIDYILTNDETVVASMYTKKSDANWKAETIANARTLKERDPVDAIRIRYRVEGHSSNGSDPKKDDYWTYQSTVEVERSKDMEEVVESLGK